MTDTQVNVPMAPISTSKGVLLSEKRTLSYLPNRPPVTIEFSDLSYTIPQGRKGNKIILRSISGLFRSGQLTAILGPSGAGKSTLLNILAGYKSTEASGTILVNGQPRDITHFRKMSRYIMQDDLVQPHLTASEVMHYAADLKLGSEVSKMQKEVIVNEIMELLFLSKARSTKTTQLSGGERKRLSIALELINNPPVIFLDEPTTGLDDLSSIQCVQLLKMLAEGGRTVICSIHTPSAKIFSLFDHVYVLAAGFCIFQGAGMDIVPFLANIGLECPKHYNPADFVIEVSSGEYGDFLEKMVSAIDNGHCYYWSQHAASRTNDSKQNHSKSVTYDCSEKEADQSNIVTNDVPEEDAIYGFSSSCFEQFRILLCRMFLQMWRDTSYVCVQVIMYIFLIGIVGGLYYNMGYDGAKQIFNFGFCYTCIIVFLYIPMLPVLLYFPTEVRLLKREYFNHWYSLRAYYCALSISRVPPQLFLGTIYVCSVYWLSNQPLEWSRLLQFLTICHLIAFTSESLGFSISSRLSIVNGMFIGPVLSVPLMLFAVYGMGSGDSVPIHMRLLMCLSYLRFGFEGLMYAVYGNDRPMMVCPPEEDYCYFRSPKDLLVFTGMENSNIYVSVVALLTNIVILRALCYFILRWRLKPHNSFAALNYVGRIIKSHFNYAQQYK